MPEPTHGAYGFRLSFPHELAQPADLVALDGGAPVISVVRHDDPPPEDLDEATPARVALASTVGSGFIAEREPASIRVDLGHPLSIDALIHPVLTVPISVFARWRGDLTLHAGAFEASGGAWGVIGSREAGKSTMLATLAQAGHPIVADDLLTIDDGHVWAGPDCVDLRPDVVDRYPDVRSIGEVGGRERFRISTPRSGARAPLRGFFLLEWTEEPRVELEPLAAREVLELLFRAEYIFMMGASDPAHVLTYGSLPVWRLRRPRDWAATQDAVGAMVGAIATA